MKLSLMLIRFFCVFLVLGLTSAARPANVVVSNLPGNEYEVSIAVNPKNPYNLVAIGHAEFGFPVADHINTFYSLDSGKSWTRVPLGSMEDGLPTGVPNFCTDPTVTFDNDGNVYVGYGVISAHTMVVCKSVNQGQTYQPCAHIIPANPQSSIDKWLITAGPDPTASRQNVYLVATIDGRIALSRSIDGASTFSMPIWVSDPSISVKSFASAAVGPGGEVYVAWQDVASVAGIYVDRSLDGGVTFGADIRVATSNAGYANTTTPAVPTRGIFAGPVIDVDRSRGAFNGRVYIVYAHNQSGIQHNYDIFVQHSTDSGMTWSAPVRASDDTGAHTHFLPWLSVDQRNGVVSAVWYDTRNDPQSRKVEVFLATSTNGAQNFNLIPNIKVSEGASDVSAGNPNYDYREYIGLAAFSCAANVIWTDYSINPDDAGYVFDRVETNCPAESQALLVLGHGRPTELRFERRPLHYDGKAGAFIGYFGSACFAIDMTYGPDGRLYVLDSSSRVGSGCIASNLVQRFNGQTGAFDDDDPYANYIPSSNFPGVESGGFTFGPDSNLYITDYSAGNPPSRGVFRYQGPFGTAPGAFMGVFVPSGSGGLLSPTKLRFGSDGNLYVADWLGNSILRYNGTTGQFIDSFIPAGSGGLKSPTDLVFGPDGNLYVTSSGGNVLRYTGPSSATPGQLLGVFANLHDASGLAFGPGDDLFVSGSQVVSGFYSAGVFRYDGKTGNAKGQFANVENPIGHGGDVGTLLFSAIPKPPVPALGDFNNDACVSTQDTNLLLVEIRKGPGAQDLRFDLTGDGQVTILDTRKLVLLFNNPKGTACQ